MRDLLKSLGNAAERYLLGVEGLIVMLLTIAALALAVFLHTGMSRIQEALPGEILAQEREISFALSDLSDLVRASHVAQASAVPRFDAVQEALDIANSRFDGVRRTFSFTALDGTSAAHAIGTPALQDIGRWLADGIPGLTANDKVVALFVETRAADAYQQMRQLLDATNATTVGLLNDQAMRLSQLRNNTLVYLGFFPVLTITIVYLLLRKRKAESRLRDSEEYFRGAFDGGGASVALLATNGHFVRVNKAFQKFFGYREAELAGKALLDLIHPEDRESCRECMESLLTGASSVASLEKRYEHKRGNTLWGYFTISVVRNADGSPRSLIAQIQDITAEKQAQAALEEREEQYRRVFEATSDSLLVFSPSGTLADANPAACALFGRSLGAMLKLNPAAHFHCDSQDVLQQLNEAISSNVAFRGEMQGLYANGTPFDAEVHGTPYRLRGEQHFLASVRNVTERREYEHQLAATAREFEQFAYLAAHDLKAPLRAVRGFSDLLVDDYEDHIDVTGREYLAFIRDGVARMDEVIDGLLGYSRLGRDGLSFESIDLADVFANVLQDLGSEIEACSARVEIGGPLPVVEGCRSMLEEVFRNLIENAIKFMAPDTTPLVCVTARESNGDYLLSVEDNGIGIEEDHCGTAFDIFQRFHASDEYAGTGIGLAVVKKGVELHGGKVRIETNSQGGCSVLVRLPRTQWRAAA